MQKEDLDNFYDSALLFLGKEMEAEERELFVQQLDSDVRLKRLFFQLKDVWEYHRLKQASSKIDLNDAWHQMLEKHKMNISDDKPRKRWLFNSVVWQSAAAFIVLIGIGWLITYLTSNSINENNLAHFIECSKGDMVRMALSDGTYVWLNSDSKLELQQDFSPANRRMGLVGEAYFEVKSDSVHPFTIDVAGYQVTVKGTSFNLRHYPDENLFQTSLEEGIVQVNRANKMITLKQGEQLNINTITGDQTLVASNNVHQFSAWRSGRLVFDNMPMEHLIKHIERWYNHTIVINDEELLQQKFSGVLKHNKSVEHIMKVLSITHPINYKIVEDTIYIEQLKPEQRIR